MFKISQYSHQNNCIGVFSLIKMQNFRPATLLKRVFNTGVFLTILTIGKKFKNTYFEEHLWTAVSESFSFYVVFLPEQITWQATYEVKMFPQKQNKKYRFKTHPDEKKLTFSWYFLSPRFSLFLHCTSGDVHFSQRSTSGGL